MSSILDAFNSLQSEFSKVNKDLQSVEDHLKKLTGGQSSSKRNLKRPASEHSGDSYLESNVEDAPKRNKFVGKAFSRVHGPSWQPKDPNGDNDDEEDSNHRPVLLSQVSAVKETKTRNEALGEQPLDEKSKARNRRMFGIILGTLQKFQSEESQRKQTTARRAQIEEKLDRQAEKERDVIRKEKKELYKKKRESQAHLRRIELKMERVQVHQELEKSHKTLINFIQTKTKPHLFYLPKEHTEESEKRWKQTKDKYRLILAEKRAKVQKELSEIDEMYKKETEMDDELDDRDDDIDSNKPMEIDSQDDKNADAIKPLDMMDKGKVCRDDINSNSIDNEKDKVDHLENTNQKSSYRINKHNKKKVKNNDEDDEVNNNSYQKVDNGESNINSNNNSNNGVNIENESNLASSDNSIKNNHASTINDNCDADSNSIAGLIANQPSDADKSSTEQLAEKEFEPIYDEDE